MTEQQQHQQTGEHCCCGAPFIIVDGVEWCEREYVTTVLNKPYGEPRKTKKNITETITKSL